MDERDNRPDVYGPAEATRALGVSPRRFRQLKLRADFPVPRELEIGSVYDGAEIRAFALQRQRGRFKDRPILDALRAWRRTGNLAEAAREVGAHRDTVARWMRAAGASIPRSG